MSEKFKLNVDVKSTATGDVCIFQKMPDTNASNVLTLAWLSKRAHPGTKLSFDWSLDYNFNWGTKGKLGKVAKFRAAQVIPANLSNKNQIDFNYEYGAYQFSNQNQNQNSEKNLYILQKGSVQANEALVGIGMSGAGSFVVESQPNLKLIFHPKPIYYVVFGDYIQGQVLDIDELTNVHKVEFNDTNEKSISLTSDDNWEET